MLETKEPEVKKRKTVLGAERTDQGREKQSTGKNARENIGMFQWLPNEILDNIALQLSTATTGRLAITCRFFRDSTTNRLHQDKQNLTPLAEIAADKIKTKFFGTETGFKKPEHKQNFRDHVLFTELPADIGQLYPCLVTKCLITKVKELDEKVFDEDFLPLNTIDRTIHASLFDFIVSTHNVAAIKECLESEMAEFSQNVEDEERIFYNEIATLFQAIRFNNHIPPIKLLELAKDHKAEFALADNESIVKYLFAIQEDDSNFDSYVLPKTGFIQVKAKPASIYIAAWLANDPKKLQQAIEVANWLKANVTLNAIDNKNIDRYIALAEECLVMANSFQSKMTM